MGINVEEDEEINILKRGLIHVESKMGTGTGIQQNPSMHFLQFFLILILTIKNLKCGRDI